MVWSWFKKEKELRVRSVAKEPKRRWTDSIEVRVASLNNECDSLKKVLLKRGGKNG